MAGQKPLFEMCWWIWVEAHRLILKPEYESQSKQEIIRSLLQKLAVPLV